MSYKLGLMLSFVFLMSVFLLGGDVVCVLAIHSELDALALTVARRLESDGTLTQATVDFVESRGAFVHLLGSGQPALGEPISFEVYRFYQSFVMSKETMAITVTRTAIVGYYQGY